MKRSASSGLEIDSAMTSVGGPRRPRMQLRGVASPAPTDKKGPAFNLRISFRQQLMEQAEDDMQNCLTRCQTGDEVFFAAAEYKRKMGEINKIYRVDGGDVVTMGNDDSMQLGLKAKTSDDDDSVDSDSTPIPDFIPTLVRSVPMNDVVQVAAGGLHSGAVTNTGDVYMWGNNDKGNLGVDLENGNDIGFGKVTKGFAPEDQHMINSISLGNSHTLFKTMRGHVYATGMMKDGDSGEFEVVPQSETKCKGNNKYPVRLEMPNGKRVKEVISGYDFAAAILEDDTLVTFGMGVNGQLARSKSMGANPLEKGMYDLSKANFLGEECTNEVYNPKTGKHETESFFKYFEEKIVKLFLTPHPVSWSTSGTHKVLSVACGELHMIVAARKDSSLESQVYVAGSGGFGQVGQQDDKLELHELTELEALRGQQIVKVAAGQSFSLALNLARNAVFSWGRQDIGSLGRSLSCAMPPKPHSYDYQPKQVEFPSSVGNILVKDIAAGLEASFAILDNNDVYSWGESDGVATGWRSKKPIFKPTKVDVLRQYKNQGSPSNCHVLQVSGGGVHSIMLVKRYT